MRYPLRRRTQIDTVIATTRIAFQEGTTTLETQQVGDALSLAYRDLIGAEARLGETLSRRGVRVGASIADQWATLHDFLNLYARGLSPAGMVVFGGRPDVGSRATGIPFTGALDAREQLGLPVKGDARSPSARGFWGAVASAREHAQDAPVEALFGSIHLAHAVPFEFPGEEPEVRDAAAAHVLRVLDAARPQAALCVGGDALATLGHALRQPDLVDLAHAPEASWATRWPAGSRLSAYPYATVPIRQPFRMRILPVPSLAGADARAAEKAIAAAFAYVLA